MIDEQKLLYPVLVVSSLALVRHYWLRSHGRRLRHPPSPRSLPFIGNLFSAPPGLDYLAYMKLGKQLNSDIIYMDMMGQPFIILNSAQIASDLLEKRSAIYSDRSCAPMVKSPTLLDWSSFPTVLPCSDAWRRQRRRMGNWLNIRAVRQFDGLQQNVVRRLLGRLLDVSEARKPFEKMKHQFSFAMAFATFKLAYGYKLKSDEDPFFLDAVQATNNLFSAMVRSNFLVNAFPVLDYLPIWFPCASWKRTAQKWREHKNRAVNAPYEWAKNQVASGEFEPSVLSALLQTHAMAPSPSTEDQDKELKELAYMLFVGGTDTSATSLVNFVAAMVVNPEVQTKAQAEVDSVLSDGIRLPTMADEAQMPYVRNLIKEVLRWHPVTPTGGEPHVCYQDDVYEGYDIQKGTIVMGNVWCS
ncbi:unnamed protein product [Rhizoctonia solani]|uniref:O-methylsterigmatocystin oxidoreductase n=1 Tax=Rhizoctonia solani TaxID=456999 RepID=A0A8H3GIQ4_9AGAM|nr:unnamed protein product [Rhizoctonia solani]